MSTFLLYNTDTQQIPWGPFPHVYTVDGQPGAYSNPLVQLEVIQQAPFTPDAGKVLRSTVTVDIPNGQYIQGYEQVDAPPAPLSAEEQDLRQSPLWPLQSELRGLFDAALNGGTVTAEQVSRAEPIHEDVEKMFARWRDYDSLTLLRSSIRLLCQPPNADFSGDAMLVGFQAQLLAIDRWNDTIPS